jgi:hypothetical protein
VENLSHLHPFKEGVLVEGRSIRSVARWGSREIPSSRSQLVEITEFLEFPPRTPPEQTINFWCDQVGIVA